MKVYVPMLQMRQVINGSRASKSKARDLKGKQNSNDGIADINTFFSFSIERDFSFQPYSLQTSEIQ